MSKVLTSQLNLLSLGNYIPLQFKKHMYDSKQCVLKQMGNSKV